MALILFFFKWLYKREWTVYLKKKKMGLEKYSMAPGTISLSLTPTVIQYQWKGGSATVVLVFWNYAVGHFLPGKSMNRYTHPCHQQDMVKSFCYRVRLPSSNPITDITLLRNLNKISWLLCACRIEIATQDYFED